MFALTGESEAFGTLAAFCGADAKRTDCVALDFVAETFADAAEMPKALLSESSLPRCCAEPDAAAPAANASGGAASVVAIPGCTGTETFSSLLIAGAAVICSDATATDGCFVGSVSPAFNGVREPLIESNAACLMSLPLAIFSGSFLFALRSTLSPRSRNQPPMAVTTTSNRSASSINKTFLRRFRRGFSSGNLTLSSRSESLTRGSSALRNSD
ncbi:MAG: hypothetical protein U0Z53_00070 [Blastocatellia bacterium]